MKLKTYLDSLGLNEEDVGTSASDVATFTGKMDMIKRNKYLEKGKRCKKHGKLNCEICEGEFEDKKWK